MKPEGDSEQRGEIRRYKALILKAKDKDSALESFASGRVEEMRKLLTFVQENPSSSTSKARGASGCDDLSGWQHNESLRYARFTCPGGAAG